MLNFCWEAGRPPKRQLLLGIRVGHRYGHDSHVGAADVTSVVKVLKIHCVHSMQLTVTALI